MDFCVVCIGGGDGVRCTCHRPFCTGALQRGQHMTCIVALDSGGPWSWSQEVPPPPICSPLPLMCYGQWH